MNFPISKEDREKLESRVAELEKELPVWKIPESFLEREDYFIAMLNLKARVYEQILNHNLYELLKEVTREAQTSENPLSSLSLLNTKATSISDKLFSKEYLEQNLEKGKPYSEKAEEVERYLEKNKDQFLSLNEINLATDALTQEEFQENYNNLSRTFQYNLAQMIAIAMHSGDERKIIPGPALIHPERTLTTFFKLVKDYAKFKEDLESQLLSNVVLASSFKIHDCFEDGSAKKLKVAGLTKSKKFLNIQEKPSLTLKKDKETGELTISKVDFTHHAILRDSLATYMIQDLYLPIILEATRKIDNRVRAYAKERGWEVKTSLTRGITNTYQGVGLLLTGILGSGNSFYTAEVDRELPNVVNKDRSIVNLTTLIVKMIDNMDNLNDMDSLELQEKLKDCSLEESAMAVIEERKEDVFFKVPENDNSQKLIKRIERYGKSIKTILKGNSLLDSYHQREDLSESEQAMIGFLGFLKERYIGELSGSISRSINYAIVKYKKLFFQQKFSYRKLNMLQDIVGEADVYETQGSFDRKQDIIRIPLDATVDSITPEMVEQVLKPSSNMLNYLSQTGKKPEQVFKFSKKRVSGRGKYSKVTPNQKAYFTLLTLYGHQEFLKRQILNQR